MLFLLRSLSFIHVSGLSVILPYYEVQTAHDKKKMEELFKALSMQIEKDYSGFIC